MLEDDVFAMAVLGLGCLIATVIAFWASSARGGSSVATAQARVEVDHEEL